MSSIVKNTIVCTLFFITCICDVTYGNELVDLWNEQYAESHRQNIRMLLIGEFDSTFSRENGDLIKTVNFKTDGQHKIVNYWFEDELKLEGTKAKKTIVIGPQKSFRITEREEGGYKALRVNLSNEQGDGVLESISSFLLLPASPFGVTSLLDAESLGKIEILDKTSVENDRVLINCKIIQSGAIVRVWHDSSKNWLVVKTETDLADGTRYQSQSIRYTDWDIEKNLTAFEVTEAIAEGGDYKTDAIIKAKRLSISKPDAELFTLENYGLPSNLGDSLGFNWSLLISFVFLLFLCLSGVFILLRKHSSKL